MYKIRYNLLASKCAYNYHYKHFKFFFFYCIKTSIKTIHPTSNLFYCCNIIIRNLENISISVIHGFTTQTRSCLDFTLGRLLAFMMLSICIKCNRIHDQKEKIILELKVKQLYILLAYQSIPLPLVTGLSTLYQIHFILSV